MSDKRRSCYTCLKICSAGERVTVEDKITVHGSAHLCADPDAQDWRSAQKLDPFGYPALGSDGCPSWTTRPFRPSNGTHGDAWEGAWCRRCKRQDDCSILAYMLMCDTDHEKYPGELVYDEFGEGICAAFDEGLSPSQVKQAEYDREMATLTEPEMWSPVYGADWATDGACMIRRDAPRPSTMQLLSGHILEWRPEVAAADFVGVLSQATTSDGVGSRVFDPRLAPIFACADDVTSNGTGAHFVWAGGDVVAVVMPRKSWADGCIDHTGAEVPQ